MSVTIPKSFQLLNRAWKVKVCETKEVFEREAKKIGADDIQSTLGLTSDLRSLILINAPLTGSDECLLQTYYHELGHAFLFTVGYTDHDEQHVDLFGGIMAQYVSTKKGEVDYGK